MGEPHPAFVEACMRYRGHVLSGKYAHWCPDWDDLPIDETCSEWPCGCGFQEYKDTTNDKPE